MMEIITKRMRAIIREMMGIKTNYIGWLFLSLIALLLVVHIGFIVSPYEIYKVGSDSMSPTLESGDYIVVNSDVNSISEGDIIVFNIVNHKSDIVHRVVGYRDGKGYVTKGDNSPYIDQKWNAKEYVNLNDVEGRYVFTIP